MSESKAWVDAPFKLIPSAKAGAEVHLSPSVATLSRIQSADCPTGWERG